MLIASHDVSMWTAKTKDKTHTHTHTQPPAASFSFIRRLHWTNSGKRLSASKPKKYILNWRMETFSIQSQVKVKSNCDLCCPLVLWYQVSIPCCQTDLLLEESELDLLFSQKMRLLNLISWTRGQSRNLAGVLKYNFACLHNLRLCKWYLMSFSCLFFLPSPAFTAQPR